MRSLVAVSVVFLSCAWGSTPSAQNQVPSVQSAPTFFEWQLLETRAGRSIGFEDWLTSLVTQDVIYVGEEHHNRFHVMAAVKILQALVEQGRHPAVGLEMLSWDVQPVLNRYLRGEISTTAFLETVRWDQTWGGSYDDYAPLIDFGREHHLPVLALNPPRLLVRRVVAVGLAQALNEFEQAGLGMGRDLPDDARYGEVITRQIELCHPGMSAQGYQRMYEASLFRDEGMAKIIADYLRNRRAEEGPLVSYTGGGHIQYQLPVPNRVSRRLPETRQASVYLSSFQLSRTEEIQGLVRDKIADYLWLTPPSAHGSPRRCGS